MRRNRDRLTLLDSPRGVYARQHEEASIGRFISVPKGIEVRLCTGCGSEIPLKRINAKPDATLCVTCAEVIGGPRRSAFIQIPTTDTLDMRATEDRAESTDFFGIAPEIADLEDEIGTPAASTLRTPWEELQITA